MTHQRTTFPRELSSRPAAGLLLLAVCLPAGCGEPKGAVDAGSREDGGDATHDGGESPTDAGEEYVAKPATEQQLEAFRVALNRWSAIQADAPNDVEKMISNLDVVLIGVLGPSSAGRKAYAFPDTYDSYANLEVRDTQLLQGALPKPSERIYVEVPWPNNIEVDELTQGTPVGARVIVLGDLVKDALEEAQKLESETDIPAVAGVKANLVMATPYGFLIEGLDGRTYAPLWEQGPYAPLLVQGADALTTFEGASTAIRAAAMR
jgi:hypothetical protein